MHDKQKDFLNHERVVKIHAPKRDDDKVVRPSDADPVFPTESEYEIDKDGDSGSRRKYPGLIWAIIAVVAVVVLCVALAQAGDWMSPQEAQNVMDAETNAQIVPEDEPTPQPDAST